MLDTPNNIVLDSSSAMGRTDLGVGSCQLKFTSSSDTDTVRPGYCSAASVVDTTTTDPVKQEVPFDSAQFGHMPEDLTTRRTTFNSMLTPPDVKLRFSRHPPNF